MKTQLLDQIIKKKQSKNEFAIVTNRTQAQEYLNVGGRVGFAEGPKDPNRRLFLKTSL